MSDIVDRLYRTAYVLLHGASPPSEDYQRGVTDTIAVSLELTSLMGKRAVAERLALSPDDLYPFPSSLVPATDDKPEADPR